MTDPLRQARGEVIRGVGAAVNAVAIGEQLMLFGVVDSLLSSPSRVVVTVEGVGKLRCRYPADYTPAAGHSVYLHRVVSGAYFCGGRVQP